MLLAGGVGLGAETSLRSAAYGADVSLEQICVGPLTDMVVPPALADTIEVR
jgi:hypothetical protein